MICWCFIIFLIFCIFCLLGIEVYKFILIILLFLDNVVNNNGFVNLFEGKSIFWLVWLNDFKNFFWEKLFGIKLIWMLSDL